MLHRHHYFFPKVLLWLLSMSLQVWQDEIGADQTAEGREGRIPAPKQRQLPDPEPGRRELESMSAQTRAELTSKKMDRYVKEERKENQCMMPLIPEGGRTTKETKKGTNQGLKRGHLDNSRPETKHKAKVIKKIIQLFLLRGS